MSGIPMCLLLGCNAQKYRRRSTSLLPSEITLGFMYFQDKCWWGDNFCTYQKCREFLHITFLFTKRTFAMQKRWEAFKYQRSAAIRSRFTLHLPLFPFKSVSSVKALQIQPFYHCELSAQASTCVLHLNWNCVWGWCICKFLVHRE